MADYFSPTVVQPSIPLAAMTPLERLLLSQIFSSEADGDGVFFYAEQGINDMPAYPADEVRAALAASGDIESPAADIVRAELAKLDADAAYLQLDMTDTSWESIFQGIVQRAPLLAYVSVVSSWTCTKMRPDGFGGMAVLITADDIMVRSTESMLDEMLGIAEYGPLGVEPGIGTHVLLRLGDEHVRSTLDVIAQTEASEGVTAGDVTDEDIREAALGVAAAFDPQPGEAEASFNAARAAMRIASSRQQTAR